MAVHKIKHGLNLPIHGEPEQRIDTGSTPRHVALLGADYLGLKPTMFVKPGDEVRRGQPLFEDKRAPGVRYTAPGSGRVTAIHRGERRAFASLVIELSAEEQSGKGAAVRFAADLGKHPSALSGDQVKALLLESGLWTALRTRPFSQVANPQTQPRSIFVTAIDTHPLAPDPAVVLAGQEDLFNSGLVALSKLTAGKVYVCTRPGAQFFRAETDRIQHEEFAGPHPAGTVGVHIHCLDPVDRHKLVWTINYQDVVAIGKLFATGELDSIRVISLAGPPVQRPRLLRTRLGAAIDDLIRGELADGELRAISGSVLSGRQAKGDVLGYLGRYHQQISVLQEDRQREFLGWLGLGTNKFSVTKVYASSLLPRKKFTLTTTTHGSDRAMIPLGTYERVFPLDLPAPFLLRSLLVADVERAELLGALELDEEDLALCSFVCPGKHEYGPHLREVLTMIQKEG